LQPKTFCCSPRRPPDRQTILFSNLKNPQNLKFTENNVGHTSGSRCCSSDKWRL
jgi:hypothetical protein